MRFILFIVATFVTAGLVGELPVASQLPSVALAQSRSVYVPPVARDMTAVDFYLHTAGVGPRISDRYGHTGIRVVDREHGTDNVYNWGGFSFREPGFAWKFFRGELTYYFMARTFSGHLEYYDRQGRRLIQDRINLTPAQKRVLMEKISWNARQENRNFRYQYWFKNCATIPRDYLDLVLSGRIQERLANKQLPVTFRSYVRSHLAAIPGIELTLELFMNANIDRPITAWEEMFLPSALRSWLLTMPRVGDDGRPIPGSHLLTDTETLLDYPEAIAGQGRDFYATALLLWLPFFAGGAFLWARRRSLGLRLIGASILCYGVLATVYGSVILLNWLFSGHPDGWHSANAWLLWPVDLVFVVTGWRLMISGRRLKDRWPVPNGLHGIVALHLLATIIAALLWSAGLIEQDLARNLFLWAPFHGIAFPALCWLAFERQPSGEKAKSVRIKRRRLAHRTRVVT